MGSNTGDIFMYDIETLDFLPYSISNSVYSKYMKKSGGSYIEDRVVGISLHPKDFNILFVVLRSYGVFLYDFEVIINYIK